MNISFESLGDLIYMMPASALVYITREWFRNFVLSKLNSEENNLPLAYIDPLALVTLGTFGLSWGGIATPDRRDNLASYVASQLWYALAVGLLVLYFHFHGPEPGSFLQMLIIYMIKFCWVLFLLNFIPLPPFDGSFFYMQKIDNGFTFVLISYMTRFIVIFVLLFDVLNVDFLKADTLLRAMGV